MGRLNAIFTWIGQHPLWLLLGIGAVFTAVWLLFLRKRLRMAWYVAIPIAVLHTACGVLCVKAFAFLETGFDPDSLGNMSLFGGVFFMPLAYLLGAKLTKRRAADVCDVFTVCMIVTVLCARVNCILSGCCQGALIPGTTGLRWPTRELEILFYLLLLLFLIPKVWHGRTDGRVYPLYMAAYGGFRFVIEFFRASSSPSVFHIAHLWSLLSLALGLSIYSELARRKGKK